MKLADDCKACRLHQGRTNIVWGQGNDDAPIFLFGEGPGELEDKYGVPFVSYAPAGQEFERFLHMNGILRHNQCYVTNTCKCRPPKNRDPKPDEAAICSKKFLYQELKIVQPKIIGAIGRFATRVFIPGAEMERIHGIPHQCYFKDLGPFTVIPIYHPAAGLRDPEKMLRTLYDFKSLADVFRGRSPNAHMADEFDGQENYRRVSDPFMVRLELEGEYVVAVDTETVRGKAWCLTLSTRPGRGILIRSDQIECLKVVAAHLSNPDVLTVLHNALFDLGILAQMGIRPTRYVDTMVMAYLLQAEPQGLKDLAYRHAGMIMEDYNDLVREISAEKYYNYLWNALQFKWPDVLPVMELQKDGPHLRQPQNMTKRIQGILKAVEKYHDRGVAIDRWKKIDPDEGKDLVEEELGPPQEGAIDEADARDPKRVTRYACRDADATLRVFPTLLQKILVLGLGDTLDTDVATIPMVDDMQRAGLEVDLPHFRTISSYFEEKATEIQVLVNNIAGHPVNLASPDQVKTLIFDELKLNEGPTREVHKGSVVKWAKQREKKPRSTGKKTLGRLRKYHPVIAHIESFRQYHKLKNTYADKIPTFMADDGRVHPSFRITRTATGRLSSFDPNIMAQPVRTKEGLMIRNGYVARKGCSFVSNDYSQIEMRILADQSQDPLLLDIFRTGKDIHALTASKMFGVPLEQVDELKHRYPAKRVGFGIVYGITAKGLLEQFLQEGLDTWTEESCQDVINAWFDVYKGARSYMDDVAEFAYENGYVKDLWGRIRFIPNVRAANRQKAAEGLRMAGNAPIQMGAQGVIKKAMGALVPVYRDMLRRGLWVWPLIQIHDDLVFEIEDKALGMATTLIKTTMENVVSLSIPIRVDSKKGKRWGSLEKYDPLEDLNQTPDEYMWESLKAA